jgi:hypothetical protein
VLTLNAPRRGVAALAASIIALTLAATPAAAEPEPPATPIPLSSDEPASLVASFEEHAVDPATATRLVHDLESGARAWDSLDPAAAYSVEAAGEEARLSNSSRALLDQIFALGGMVAVPGASAGVSVGVAAATTAAPDLLAKIIPQVLTDDQLLEIRNNPKAAGRDELETRIRDALETALSGMNPPYTVEEAGIRLVRPVTIDDFAKNISEAYDTAAAAFSSEETDGAYSVSLSHSDETVSRDQMAAGKVN